MKTKMTATASVPFRAILTVTRLVYDHVEIKGDEHGMTLGEKIDQMLREAIAWGEPIQDIKFHIEPEEFDAMARAMPEEEASRVRAATRPWMEEQHRRMSQPAEVYDDSRDKY